MRESLVIASSIALTALTALTACNERTLANRSEPPPAAPSASVKPVPTASGVSSSYADVVDRVSPAVVTVRSARRSRAPEQFPFMDDPFFQRFFGERSPGGSRGGPGQVEHGLGSGVVVRGGGHILTNHHVVDGAEEIKVDLSDRRTYTATLVGSDPPSDLAVLKIDAKDLPLLSLADSDAVRVGDVCLALSNPLGIGQTVRSGIVSAKSRATPRPIGRDRNTGVLCRNRIGAEAHIQAHQRFEFCRLPHAPRRPQGKRRDGCH